VRTGAAVGTDSRAGAGDGDAVTLLAVGDLILDEPDPDSFFAPSAPLLASADLAIGHVEVPHTDRGEESGTDVPAPPAPVAHLAALARAGFGVATLAGNHIADQGRAGITDTVAELRRLGLATAGAGPDLPAARAPAVVERNGLRIGVLSYNCVGPRESWATSAKAGCAYVRVLTHYELDHASPGGPPEIFTFATPASLAAMASDVAALAVSADVVVVALHKGVGHTPAAIADYEGQVARAAVDAGAHVVLGHHAHIMRGIEVHRGRPIFHGLGNFVTVTRALAVEDNASPERLAWARRRRELFGFEPDPDMPTYPFHPESRHTIVARIVVGREGVREAGFVPCWIDGAARPVPCAPGEGAATVAYVERITAAAGLRTRFEAVEAGHHRVVLDEEGTDPPEEAT
jgi:poly-gamma-glutamate capsule biosynthesis protein CapA/YwtB (metallophosphatase superfamily)